MLSIIIPACRPEQEIKTTLRNFTSGRTRYEVILSGPHDDEGWQEYARKHDALYVVGGKTRGEQKRAGVSVAKHPWLLFLHPGITLEKGWFEAAQTFSENNESRLAAFSYKLDDDSSAARQVESLAALRQRMLTPGGAQGLLINRALYNKLGGFKPWPVGEDIAFFQRALKEGYGPVEIMKPAATQSADIHKKHGYINIGIKRICALYFSYVRVPPQWIVNILGEKYL